MKNIKELIGIIFVTLSGITLALIGIFTAFNQSNNQINDGYSLVTSTKNNGIKLSTSTSQAVTNNSTIHVIAEVGPRETIDKTVNLSLEWITSRTIYFEREEYTKHPYSSMFINSGCQITSNNDYSLISGGYLLFSVPSNVSVTIGMDGSNNDYTLDDGKTLTNHKATFTYTNDTSSNLFLKLVPTIGFSNYLKYVKFDYAPNGDVSEYMSATPYYDYSNQTTDCTIIRNKAFSTPIKLIVKSNSNPDLTATADIDFVGRTLTTCEVVDCNDDEYLERTYYAGFQENVKSINYYAIGGTIFGNVSDLTISNETPWLMNCNDGSTKIYPEEIIGDYEQMTLLQCITETADISGANLGSLYTSIYNTGKIKAYFNYNIYYGDLLLTSMSNQAVNVNVLWPVLKAESVTLNNTALIF